MNASYKRLLAQKNSVSLQIINKKMASERSGTGITEKLALGIAIAALRITLSELEKELSNWA